MNINTIKHYLQFITSVEEMGGTRTRYHVGNNFIIDVGTCEHDLKNKNDLMNLWYKAGYIIQKLPTHIVIDTYYTDTNGICRNYYNITHTTDHKINFNYICEAKKENINLLVAECIRMYEMNITH